MADIRNCPRCGRIFNYVNRLICPICVEAEEGEYKIVKDYIYDHKGACISEVSEATGVSVEKIMRFLRDERLEIASNSDNLFLECERCGRPIPSGRFCPACKSNLETSLKREFGIGQKKTEDKPALRSDDNDRMYTANRKKE